MLTSEAATALAMVLTELVQNAVEHGQPGVTGRSCRRAAAVGRLRVTVDDDGAGLPEGFDLDASSSLGLTIVGTLVESELGGRLDARARDPRARGTRVEIDVRSSELRPA